MPSTHILIPSRGFFGVLEANSYFEKSSTGSTLPCATDLGLGKAQTLGFASSDQAVLGVRFKK